MISISVDATQALIGLKSISKYITEEVNKALDILMPKIQEYARAQHRFITRTGRLERSITQDVKDLIGDLYINDLVAPYGKYVHEGHGTWAPDQFIYDAINAFDKIIQQTLEQAVDRAIVKAGF